MPLPREFEDALAAGFSKDFASTDASDLEAYGRDWTRVHTPAPSVLCRPRTTDEVSRLLALCSHHRVPVVPSGGRTGLAGGAVASQGELVLSLERLHEQDWKSAGEWTHRAANHALDHYGAQVIYVLKTQRVQCVYRQWRTTHPQLFERLEGNGKEGAK